jgi:hypothetical protein
MSARIDALSGHFKRRRVGRVRLDSFAEVRTVDLIRALDLAPPVGEEFALLRELRERGETPERWSR